MGSVYSQGDCCRKQGTLSKSICFFLGLIDCFFPSPNQVI